MTKKLAKLQSEFGQVEQITAAQRALKDILADARRETLVELHQKETALQAQLAGSGSIAQGAGATSVTATNGGTAIGLVQGSVYIR